jgi:hypothetical protein
VAFIEELGGWLAVGENHARYKAFMSHELEGGQRRIASFLACSDDDKVLEHLEGDTDRFVAFRIKKIWNKKAISEDVEVKEAAGIEAKPRPAAEDFDISKAWAAAYALYKEGFNPDYTSRELDSNRRSNKGKTAKDPSLEVFHRFFEPCLPETPGSKFINTSELSDLLNEVQQDVKFNAFKLGRLLSAEGVKRYHFGKKYGYYVRFIHPDA